MGTKGVLYIYNKTLGTYIVLMLNRDSRTELLQIRREFMKLKTFKAKENLIASLKSHSNIIDITFAISISNPVTNITIMPLTITNVIKVGIERMRFNT